MKRGLDSMSPPQVTIEDAYSKAQRAIDYSRERLEEHADAIAGLQQAHTELVVEIRALRKDLSDNQRESLRVLKEISDMRRTDQDLYRQVQELAASKGASQGRAWGAGLGAVAALVIEAVRAIAGLVQ